MIKMLGVSVKELGKWADRVYAENDFGRSIATSVSGVIGLITYLITSDWVLSALSLIIVFPIIRIFSTGVNERLERNKLRAVEKEKLEYSLNRLTDEELQVVQVFVSAGGSVLTWNQMNNVDVASAGVESLMKRDLIFTSSTADGMRETFVLDQEIFDIAYEKYGRIESS
jgi:ABC-type multidrug transport system fused ATPase/permease subunit